MLLPLVVAFFASNVLPASAQIAGTPASAQNRLSLTQSALTEILDRAKPLMGTDTGCSPSVSTCNWMAKVAGSTNLADMNLPGTHDAATWNYSDATQAALERYTGPIPPAEVFRCQELSLFDQLNDGIRVFDLRIAYNPGNDTIGFYHSQALLAPTTTLTDVLYGFYYWLTQHPTETVLLSINHESGTGTPLDLKFEEILFGTLTSPVAKQFWWQGAGQLPTLTNARGKLILLQRFDWRFLSPPPLLMGIHLNASLWLDNNPEITLVYNTTSNPQKIAYIEDMYEPLIPPNSGTAANIQSKFNATSLHITEAMTNFTNGGKAGRDAFFISFASAEKTSDDVPVVPQVMALGNTSATPGVNQLLLPWLKANVAKGKRAGVVMLDFYDQPKGLVQAVIGI